MASFPSSGGGGNFRKKGLHPFSPFPCLGLRRHRFGVCQLFALPLYVIMHSRLVSVFAFLKPGRAPAGTGGRNAREGNGFPSERRCPRSSGSRFPLLHILLHIAARLVQDAGIKAGPGAADNDERGHVDLGGGELGQLARPFGFLLPARVFDVGAQDVPAPMFPENCKRFVQQSPPFAPGGVVFPPPP